MQGTILLTSLLTGFSTAIGAVFILLMGQISKGRLAFVLGFAAGIMFAISIFSLLPVGVAYGTFWQVAAGFGVGVAFMFLLDLLVSRSGEPISTASRDYFKMGCFIALGIALHNLPEGLALGAGYQVTDKMGFMLASAIALHNIPEGIGIAAPLKMSGSKSWLILFITALAGTFTLLGTVISLLLFQISSHLLAVAMGFAAGAMIYIASDELIPRSRGENSVKANWGILSGFLLVLLLSFL